MDRFADLIMQIQAQYEEGRITATDFFIAVCTRIELDRLDVALAHCTQEKLDLLRLHLADYRDADPGKWPRHVRMATWINGTGDNVSKHGRSLEQQRFQQGVMLLRTLL